MCNIDYTYSGSQAKRVGLFETIRMTRQEIISEKILDNSWYFRISFVDWRLMKLEK